MYKSHESEVYMDVMRERFEIFSSFFFCKDEIMDLGQKMKIPSDVKC